MNAVAKIDISRTAFAKHRLRSLGALVSVSMTRFVSDAGIGLGFGDYYLRLIAVYTCAQHLAEQLIADRNNVVSPVEVTRQFHLSNPGASTSATVETMTIPMRLRKTPARTICGMLINPVENTMAFGGVATGNMNAQLAAIVIGTVSTIGGTPA